MTGISVRGGRSFPAEATRRNDRLKFAEVDFADSAQCLGGSHGCFTDRFARHGFHSEALRHDTWASQDAASEDGASEDGASEDGSITVLEAPAGVAGLDDVAMIGQPIEHGGGHFGAAEDLWPIGEGEVGGDQQGGVLVEFADQVEQQLSAGLAERVVVEFIDDDEVVAQQLLGEASAAAGGLLPLELVDEVDKIDCAAASSGRWRGRRRCSGCDRL